MAQPVYKRTRVPIRTWDVIYSDAGEGGYSSRLSDFLNNPDMHFLALSSVKVEALPGPDIKVRRAISRRQ
jgi:hypothetical protein